MGEGKKKGKTEILGSGLFGFLELIT